MPVPTSAPARRPVRRLARHLLAVAGLAISPAAAHAADADLRFDGAGSTSAFGYAVGPYSGTLIRPGMSFGLTLFCVDFLDHVSIGDQVPVNLTSLAAADLAATRHPGELEAYRKAAWLSDQFANSSQDRWGGIQAAMWQLFAPGAPDGGTDAADPRTEAYWEGRANVFAMSASYTSYDWSRFWVVTDVRAAGIPSGVGIQEFITGSPNIVPEPQTLAMIATGLAGLGAAGWRARRRA